MGSEIKIKNKTIKALRQHRKEKSLLCKAPFVSMSIGLEGKISPCCYTQMTDPDLGIEVYPAKTLNKIWNGDYFNGYRKLIKSNKLPLSCSICANKLKKHEFNSLKTEEYTNFDATKSYPSIIEIAVDNTCNLECIMCNSTLSSSIAKTNGLKAQYGINLDQLFEELKQYIPHLTDMIFTGGEPLLSNYYFKIWQYIIELNPKCNITLNTNASILPERIKTLLEKGKFHFNISLDSVNPEVYERIRVNAKFETTINNFLYLKDYCKRKSTSLSVAVCPLTTNYKTIPALVDFCDTHEANIFFVHIFQAYEVALSSASSSEIKNAIKYFKKIKENTSTQTSRQNYLHVCDLIKRAEQWLQETNKRNKYINSQIKSNNNSQIFKDKFITNISNYLEKNDTYSKDKTQILNKLNIILQKAPAYTNTKDFYQKLDRYDASIIVEQIQFKTERELLWQFETIFRDGMNNK